MPKKTRDTVLVVDDQPNWRDTVSDILTQKFDVIARGSYDEALDTLKQRQDSVGVAVVDIRLNDDDSLDESGLRLIQAIKNKNKNMNTIVLTGYPTLGTAKHAFRDLAVFDYIEKVPANRKGLDVEQLLETVRKANEDFKFKQLRFDIEEFGERLKSEPDMQERDILELVYQQISQLIDIRHSYVAIVSPKSQDGQEQPTSLRTGLIVDHGKTLAPEKTIHNLTPAEETLVKSIFHTRQTHCPENTKSIDKNQAYQFWAVPMTTSKKVLGVIILKGDSGSTPFCTEDTKNALESISQQAAGPLENAKTYNDFQKRLKGVGEAQARIAETEAILTRTSLATDFVHEMNNLAGVIPVKIDTIKEGLYTGKHEGGLLIKYLDDIAHVADELLETVARLKSPPEPQLIDICELLTATEQRVHIEQPASFEVVLDCQEYLPHVKAVSAQLVYIFWNIVQNGIEAMPDGGRIFITARRIELNKRHPAVEITIKDEGPGISTEELENIFDPFYTTKHSGVGYGLWRTKKIIENLGGTIRPESLPNKGATFTITLPATNERAK